MRFASLVIPLLLACGYLYSGEEISPMRGRTIIRPGRATPYQMNSVGGLQRLASESPAREDSGPQVIQPKEFVRIKLPPVAAEMPARPRFIIVDNQPDGDAINFAPRSPQMQTDEVGIPGLIAPEALAIDKYTLHGDGKRTRRVTLPSEPEPQALFDIASADWNSKARAFPGFSDRMPEIAIHEHLLPTAETTVAIGALTAMPAHESNATQQPATASLSGFPFQTESPPVFAAENAPAPPAWDIASLPRGEVRGIEPPSALTPFPLLSAPPLPAPPEAASVLASEKALETPMTPPWDVAALPRSEVKGIAPSSSVHRQPPPMPTYQPSLPAAISSEPAAMPALPPALLLLSNSVPEMDAGGEYTEVNASLSKPPLPPGM